MSLFDIKTICCGVILASANLAAQTPEAPAQASNTPAQAPATPAQAPAAQPPSTPAQTTDTPAPKTSTKSSNVSERHFFYGLRVEAFPLRLFDTSVRQGATTQPIANYIYNGSSSSQKAAAAGTVEYIVNRHISTSIEFYLTHVKFIQDTQVRTGLPDPNAGTDTRPVTSYNQTSTVDYWVLPFIARYRGIRQSGKFSRAYLLGGAEYRHVGRIRTGTDILFPDGTNSYNEIPATPTQSNQVGAVVGVGMRFFDQIGFKLMPEIRYVRWVGYTFQGPSYASTKNQVEASLGISF
jgi:hypothetical protein